MHPVPPRDAFICCFINSSAFAGHKVIFSFGLFRPDNYRDPDMI